MALLSSDRAQTAQTGSTSALEQIWRGALIGCIPLALLVGIAAVALTLIAFVRQLTAASGFFVQQQVSVSILVVGLSLAVLAYVIAIVLTMRWIAMWQQTGSIVRARSALCVLAMTALVVILPLLLAVFLPQHPAP